jgi:hypothetical protein
MFDFRFMHRYTWNSGKQEMVVEGPFTEESTLRSLELLDDINFVYICTKSQHTGAQEAGEAGKISREVWHDGASAP